MKLLFSILLLTLASNANADIRDQLRQCERSCSPRCERFVGKLQNRLNRITSSCDYNEPRPPRRGAKVRLYKSDSCNGSYLGSISARTDCREFANNVNSRVWAIEVNGECTDISDTSSLAACKAFKVAPSSGVVLWKSDSCSGSAVAVVNDRSDCQSMATNISSRVWAFSVNGQCTDINDTDFRRACNLYKNEF